MLSLGFHISSLYYILVLFVVGDKEVVHAISRHNTTLATLDKIISRHLSRWPKRWKWNRSESVGRPPIRATHLAGTWSPSGCSQALNARWAKTSKILGSFAVMAIPKMSWLSSLGSLGWEGGKLESQTSTLWGPSFDFWGVAHGIFCKQLIFVSMSRSARQCPSLRKRDL